MKVEPAAFAGRWGVKGGCRALGPSSWKMGGSVFVELLVWEHSKLRMPLDESGDASRLWRG